MLSLNVMFPLGLSKLYRLLLSTDRTHKECGNRTADDLSTLFFPPPGGGHATSSVHLGAVSLLAFLLLLLCICKNTKTNRVAAHVCLLFTLSLTTVVGINRSRRLHEEPIQAPLRIVIINRKDRVTPSNCLLVIDLWPALSTPCMSE